MEWIYKAVTNPCYLKFILKVFTCFINISCTSWDYKKIN